VSIEQLLFLLFLLGLPLLERLIRATRTRRSESSAERAGNSAERDASRSGLPGSTHDASGTASEGRQTELPLPAPLPPALPQAFAHAVPEPLRATEGPLHVRKESRRGPAIRPRTGVHSESSPVALRQVMVDGELRRAIVLIAILGPCRALEPKDASQPR
jgi:hypothetical protein